MEILLFIGLVWAVVRGMSDDTPGGSRPAQRRVDKYGMWDHLADLWSDSWIRETDKTISKRDARARAKAAGEPQPPGWWRRRRDAAEDRLAARWEARRPPSPAEPGAAPTPRPEPERPRVRVQPRPAEPAAAANGTKPPDSTTKPDPAEAKPPATPTTTSAGGTTMTGPTGEVVNHETHIAELDATIAELRAGIDLCNAVEGTSTTLRGQVDDLQSKYGPVASAAQTRADHLQAMNVDATTTGHAAEGADALDPNAVTRYHDEAENIEAGARSLRDRLERALAAAEAERAEAIRRYADAQDTVNTDLGGNTSYLGGNSGGASGAPGAQQSGSPSFHTQGPATGNHTQQNADTLAAAGSYN